MGEWRTRRLASLGVAIGLTLGSGAIAIAATAPSLPEQADGVAHQQVDAAVEQDEEQGDELDGPPEDTEEVTGEGEGESENAEAFSEWAESLPEDWGCIRGFLISRAARGDHRGDDFEGPTYASVEEAATAAEALGLEGRCVEVAVNGEDAADAEGAGPPGDAGPPEHAGRPEHAGPPEHAGAPEHAGPPADAGPPTDAGQ